MSQLCTLAIAAVLLALVFAHPQYRQIICKTPDGKLRGGPVQARCHMVIKDTEDENPGRAAKEGDGCFTETLNGEKHETCDLVCPKAHTVFLAHIDQGHRSCFNFYTYKIEKRGQDWYLWRNGKCLNSTVEFTIGCKFDEPFSTQFKSDNEVFARLAKARARKA